MGDLFFVIKSLVLTVILVAVMQVRIGGRTLEHQTTAWIQNSSVVDNLRMVAEGAVKVVSEGYDSSSSIAQKQISGLVSELSYKSNSFSNGATSTEQASSEQIQEPAVQRARTRRVQSRTTTQSTAGPEGPEID